MLRHFLATTARMSSRSIFTKPNTSIYVSSLRSLSDQRESMLRHIYTSAARTSPRSLFANSNSSVYVSSLRFRFSNQKKSTGQKRFSKNDTAAEKERKEECMTEDDIYVLFGICFVVSVLLVVHVIVPFASFVKEMDNTKMCCTKKFRLMHESYIYPVDTTVQSFKFAKVSLQVLPIMWKDKIEIRSNVEVELPNRGHRSAGKCSEEEVRRALTKFALKQLHDGLGKHLSENCKCGHFAAPSKASSDPVNTPIQPIQTPDLFEGSEVEVTVMLPRMLNLSNISICCTAEMLIPNADNNARNEICDELKRHGIHVDCSFMQVRRGIATFALKQMLDKLGQHLEKNCEFSNAASQSIKDGSGKRHRTKCTCGCFFDPFTSDYDNSEGDEEFVNRVYRIMF